MDFNAPERVINIRDISLVYQEAEKQEYKDEKEIERYENDMNISTMSKDMAVKWEQYLGIAPQDDDTIEEKRFRIKAVVNERAPYTIEAFKRRLEVIAGEDNIRVTQESNIVHIVIALQQKKMYDCIVKLAEDIVPLDQILDIQVAFNRWLDFEDCKYEGMKQYTWQQILDEDVNVLKRNM